MLHWFAKRLRDMQEVSRDERGFTLIELLIVIAIIGILAAIAIPSFLAQRTKAQDAAAKSDARNAGAAETMFFADSPTNSWATTKAELITQGFRQSAGTTFEDANIHVPAAVAADGAYCLEVQSASTAWFHMAEAGGGVQAGQCGT